jgi:hypothetical protein
MANPFARKPEQAPVRFASQIEAIKRDPWHAITPSQHPQINLPAFPIASHQTQLIESAVLAVPAAPARMEFKHVPFESIGPSISLVDLVGSGPKHDQRYIDALQLHAWLRVHTALCAPNRFPVAAAMRWGYPQFEQVASLIWYEVGGAMLCTWPTIRRVGLNLHLSLGHCILHWQGWMHSHNPSRLEDWVDLTTNYHQLFDQRGRAYSDITEAYFRGDVYWGMHTTMTDRVLTKFFPRTKLGQVNIVTGGADVASLPIRFNQEARSFLHWTVGTPPFPAGSPQAAVLHDVRIAMIGSFQEFRESTAQLPAQPSIQRNLGQSFIREEA